LAGWRPSAGCYGAAVLREAASDAAKITGFVNRLLEIKKGTASMGAMNERELARLKRKKRIRKKIFGTQGRPRLCVFRSAKHIYAQIVDDSCGKTVVAASSVEKAVMAQKFGGKVEKANLIGKLIAERALGKGIEKVVFDRNGFLYHGRIKAVSDGARQAGLVF
jgi:large subunit ribosomal protein L18